MNRLLPLAAILASATAAWAANDSTAKPRTPAEALQSFEVAPGLKVELVAAEPLVASPCALAFDNAGRLYVAENRGYPIGPKEGDPGAGKIALLEDTDHDGKMDKRTEFAEGLGFPNGVLPWKGGLLVTDAPNFLFLQDTDGDGKADVRRVLLTGFETAKSTQLRVNRPTLGPDGWIYLASGLSGGNITSPEHPEMPAVKMTSDLRWHPETGVFELVDGKSQFGQSFDAAGRRFICMNRVQVQHVVLPSRYLKRNPLFAFSDSVQNCPELIPNMLMHSTGGAARLYPISSNITTADSHVGTFSAACGVMIWRNGALPPEYEGAALSCDPTGNLVHADKLILKGASFAAVPLIEKRELLAFRDDWARPVFLEIGPDGALYVCDMYRKVIEHPDYLSAEIRKHTDFESGKQLGRIWRVRSENPSLHRLDGWEGRRETVQTVEKRSAGRIPGLHWEMQSPNHISTTVLQMLGALGAVEKGDLEAAFASGKADVVEVALRLCEGQEEWQELGRARLPKLLEFPRVRFQLALSIENLELPVLAEILRRSEGDRWTDAAVFSAAAKRALPLLEELQRQAPGFDSPALQTAGRLVGAGKEAPDVATLVQKLTGLTTGLPAVVAGFCEATKARLDPANPAVQTLLTKAASASDLQAVTLLSFAPWEVAGDALFRAAAQTAQPELQQAAIRALASFDRPEVAQTLLTKARWTAAPPAEREAILSALLARPFHHSGLLTAVEGGNLPASAIPTVRRNVLLKGKEKERAEKLFAASAGNRQQAYEAAKEALSLTPQPTHGRELFKAICSTCHRLNQEGYAVGPDLFDIRNQPKENVLFHILVPDAEVAPAFTAYSVETKDGRNLAGLMASETATSVTLRMPLAQEETILRANLQTITALPNSLMPTGLEGAMSRQDLADLLGYLKGER